MESSHDEPFRGIEAEPGPSIFALHSPKESRWISGGRVIWGLLHNRWFWWSSLWGAFAIMMAAERLRDYFKAIGSWLWVLF